MLMSSRSASPHRRVLTPSARGEALGCDAPEVLSSKLLLIQMESQQMLSRNCDLIAENQQLRAQLQLKKGESEGGRGLWRAEPQPAPTPPLRSTTTATASSGCQADDGGALAEAAHIFREITAALRSLRSVVLQRIVEMLPVEEVECRLEALRQRAPASYPSSSSFFSAEGKTAPSPTQTLATELAELIEDVNSFARAARCKTDAQDKVLDLVETKLQQVERESVAERLAAQRTSASQQAAIDALQREKSKLIADAHAENAKNEELRCRVNTLVEEVDRMGTEMQSLRTRYTHASTKLLALHALYTGEAAPGEEEGAGKDSMATARRIDERRAQELVDVGAALSVDPRDTRRLLRSLRAEELRLVAMDLAAELATGHAAAGDPTGDEELPCPDDGYKPCEPHALGGNDFSLLLRARTAADGEGGATAPCTLPGPAPVPDRHAAVLADAVAKFRVASPPC